MIRKISFVEKKTAWYDVAVCGSAYFGKTTCGKMKGCCHVDPPLYLRINPQRNNLNTESFPRKQNLPEPNC